MTSNTTTTQLEYGEYDNKVVFKFDYMFYIAAYHTYIPSFTLELPIIIKYIHAGGTGHVF